MTDSKIKTVLKKTLSSKNKEEVDKLYKEAVSVIDKGAAKGRLHKNNAARKKAKLTKHLNNLAAAK